MHLFEQLSKALPCMVCSFHGGREVKGLFPWKSLRPKPAEQLDSHLFVLFIFQEEFCAANERLFNLLTAYNNIVSFTFLVSLPTVCFCAVFLEVMLDNFFAVVL